MHRRLVDCALDHTYLYIPMHTYTYRGLVDCALDCAPGVAIVGCPALSPTCGHSVDPPPPLCMPSVQAPQ